jgi:hypothetical protein
VHPIWRGIGCILVVVFPFLAFAAADLLVQMNIDQGWYPFPFELTRAYYFSPLSLSLRHFYGNLMVTALLLLFGFAVIMVVYALIYAVMGPSRYGPLDAPPIHKKTRRSR